MPVRRSTSRRSSRHARTMRKRAGSLRQKARSLRKSIRASLRRMAGGGLINAWQGNFPGSEATAPTQTICDVPEMREIAFGTTPRMAGGALNMSEAYFGGEPLGYAPLGPSPQKVVGGKRSSRRTRSKRSARKVRR